MNLMMDVSHYDARRWQGTGWVNDRPVDWNRARGLGITAAAIKGSEGGRVLRAGRWVDGAVEDPALRVQWAAAAGRPRLYWHFFRSNRNAIAQALDVLAIWESLETTPDDRLALDFETEDGMSGAACLAAAASWLYEVERDTKMIPWLYTYPAFWIRVGGTRAAWAKRYPLWLAQWPLDLWIANLFPITPLFAGERLTSLLRDVESGKLSPLNGKPYYNSLAPWGMKIPVWQFTARIASSAVPGHPAIKKAVDMSIVYEPWWLQPESDPTPEPTPDPTPEPQKPTHRLNRGAWVLSGPGNQYRATKLLPAGTIVTVLRITGLFAELAEGGYVYKSLIEEVIQ